VRQTMMLERMMEGFVGIVRDKGTHRARTLPCGIGDDAALPPPADIGRQGRSPQLPGTGREVREIAAELKAHPRM
jgi:hypothetical protein